MEQRETTKSQKLKTTRYKKPDAKTGSSATRDKTHKLSETSDKSKGAKKDTQKQARRIASASEVGDSNEVFGHAASGSLLATPPSPIVPLRFRVRPASVSLPITLDTKHASMENISSTKHMSPRLTRSVTARIKKPLISLPKLWESKRESTEHGDKKKENTKTKSTKTISEKSNMLPLPQTYDRQQTQKEIEIKQVPDINTHPSKHHSHKRTDILEDVCDKLKSDFDTTDEKNTSEKITDPAVERFSFSSSSSLSETASDNSSHTATVTGELKLEPGDLNKATESAEQTSDARYTSTLVVENHKAMTSERVERERQDNMHNTLITGTDLKDRNGTEESTDVGIIPKNKLNEKTSPGILPSVPELEAMANTQSVPKIHREFTKSPDSESPDNESMPEEEISIEEQFSRIMDELETSYLESGVPTFIERLEQTSNAQNGTDNTDGMHASLGIPIVLKGESVTEGTNSPIWNERSVDEPELSEVLTKKPNKNNESPEILEPLGDSHKQVFSGNQTIAISDDHVTSDMNKTDQEVTHAETVDEVESKIGTTNLSVLNNEKIITGNDLKEDVFHTTAVGVDQKKIIHNESQMENKDHVIPVSTVETVEMEVCNLQKDEIPYELKPLEKLERTSTKECKELSESVSNVVDIPEELTDANVSIEARVQTTEYLVTASSLDQTKEKTYENENEDQIEKEDVNVSTPGLDDDIPKLNIVGASMDKESNDTSETETNIDLGKAIPSDSPNENDNDKNEYTTDLNDDKVKLTEAELVTQSNTKIEQITSTENQTDGMLHGFKIGHLISETTLELNKDTLQSENTVVQHNKVVENKPNATVDTTDYVSVIDNKVQATNTATQIDEIFEETVVSVYSLSENIPETDKRTVQLSGNGNDEIKEDTLQTTKLAIKTNAQVSEIIGELEENTPGSVTDMAHASETENQMDKNIEDTFPNRRIDVKIETDAQEKRLLGDITVSMLNNDIDTTQDTCTEKRNYTSNDERVPTGHISLETDAQENKAACEIGQRMLIHDERTTKTAHNEIDTGKSNEDTLEAIHITLETQVREKQNKGEAIILDYDEVTEQVSNTENQTAQDNEDTVHVRHSTQETILHEIQTVDESVDEAKTKTVPAEVKQMVASDDESNGYIDSETDDESENKTTPISMIRKLSPYVIPVGLGVVGVCVLFRYTLR